MSEKKSILFNTSIRWAGEIISKILWFALFIILARALGDSDFGYFAYCFAFGSMIVALTDLGTNIFLLKAITKNKKIGEYLWNVLGLKTVVSILVFLITVILALTTAKHPHILIIITTSLLISAFFDPAVYVFRAQRHMHYETILILVWRALSVGLITGGLYYFGFKLLESSLCLIISATLSVLLAAVIIKKAYGVDYFKLVKPDYKSWKNILSESIPMGLLLILGGIFFKFNVLVLEHFKEAGEVGWYSASFKLIEGSFFISSIFMGSIFPAMCEANEKNNPERNAYKLLKKAFVFLISISLFGAIIVNFWAKEIINIVYGNHFLNAAAPLKILVWALIFIYLNELFFYFNLSAERQKLIFKLMTISVIAYVILCFTLIPSAGVKGAAWTLFITQAFLFILNIVSLKIVGDLRL